MMKKLVKLIRIALSALIVFGWYKGYMALLNFHYACCPELHATALNQWLVFLPLVCCFLLMVFPITAIAMGSGYQLHKLHWLFLEITKPDKLRVRWTKKLGWSVRLLPPRTDGTSPYVCYSLSGYMCFGALALLLTLLAVVCWRTPAARYLNILAPACLLVVIAWPLLPTRSNVFDRIRVFRKNRDLRRAWECNLHITAAFERKEKLTDLPDEWFLPYPAEIADDPIVRYANFNRASWLINQDRWAEGYEVLRYFFDLVPAPKTHAMIASAILNGVMCEALGDLPPMCMSQLDHPSLKLPLPQNWENQRLLAEYARALFLHRDEAEAAAILPKLEAAFDKEGRTREGIEKLQRKAGILPEYPAACPDANEGGHHVS